MNAEPSPSLNDTPIGSVRPHPHFVVRSSVRSTLTLTHQMNGADSQIMFRLGHPGNWFSSLPLILIADLPVGGQKSCWNTEWDASIEHYGNEWIPSSGMFEWCDVVSSPCSASRSLQHWNALRSLSRRECMVDNECRHFIVFKVIALGRQH